APHEHPMATGAGRQAGDPPHAQRLGPRPRAHRRGDPRGLPAAGRLDRRPGRPPAPTRRTHHRLMADARDPDLAEGIPVVWFETPAALWAWLEARGGSPDDPGVWVRLAKVGDVRPCITFHDLLEAGIAFG